MSELVKIRMHGIFGEKIGKEFNLAVGSVPEAFHAINVITDDGIRRLQLQNIQDDLKYSVLVNEKPVDLSSLSHINEENMNQQESINAIHNSELFLNQKEGLRSIDIVPSNEGGNPFVVFVILVIVVTLIQLMLMKPPKFDDFREIEDTRKGQSYLFSGPQNTVNEGGPIPLGYGRAVIGSQVVAQSYEVYYENADGTDANISSSERVSQNESGGDNTISNLENPEQAIGIQMGQIYLASTYS
jgi:predicted phage tail protein